MNDGQQADAADVLASIGRHWGWIMAFGVLTLLAGVAVLAWPGRTLVVIAVLFGVQLIVTGIFRFVAAFAADDLTGDVNRYLDFVNDAIYDLMVIGQATAKANVRDVIEPWDLPITKGLQESMHQFEKLEEEIELQPILESLAARPPLDVTLDEETEARLPLIFGGISVALAKTFKFIDAELKAVHTEEWERTFSLFRLLI